MQGLRQACGLAETQRLAGSLAGTPARGLAGSPAETLAGTPP
jgi:hypothetical protein